MAMMAKSHIVSLTILYIYATVPNTTFFYCFVMKNFFSNEGENFS